MSTADDPARQRFFLLTMLRLAAAVLVALGLITGFSDRGWLSDAWAMPVGILLIAMGAAILLGIVPALTRRWRSPE